MLKKIDTRELKPGMYVHDLSSDWMSHPFLRNRFLLRSEDEIQKILAAGIHDCYIDTDKGLDVRHAPTAAEVSADLDAKIREIASTAPPPPRKYTAAEELANASKVHREANLIVKNILTDSRLGKQVMLEKVTPLVEKMTESILRNNGALLSLTRIKDKDNYTFQHSVSVGALMVSFCRALEMDAATIHHAGVGGMLHDIGKMTIPDNILNKPGRLTEAEFGQMKCHVEESRRILTDTSGISDIAINVAWQHHERHDGSGYPRGLKGDDISQLGQMAAIVDVYDAITSTRVYHAGMSPTEALRKIFEWSKFHFNPVLVQAFMRTIGIYPVGTLVMLESGRLAVVLEQSEQHLLQPRVKAFFSSKSNTYITPLEIDLSKSMGKGGADAIVSHESPEKWRIDPSRFL